MNSIGTKKRGWLAILFPVVGSIILWLSFLLMILFQPPALYFAVFLTGTGLIWFSRARIIFKIIATLFPILVIVGINTYPLLTYRPHRPTAIVYLIPETFKGRVIVVTNQPCGEQAVRSGDSVLLKIPQGGILILNEDLFSDSYTSSAYLVDSNGFRKRKLGNRDNADDEVEHASDSTNKTHLEIMGERSSGLLKDQPEKSRSSFIEFNNFFVLPSDSLPDLFPIDRQRVQQLIDDCKLHQ